MDYEGELFYDRQGRPIDIATFGRLAEDLDYKRLALTFVGPLRVSTVWLGIDHGFLEKRPLLFETMVFGEGWGDWEMWRYATEAEALAGHDQVVAEVRDRVRGWLIPDSGMTKAPPAGEPGASDDPSVIESLVQPQGIETGEADGAS